MIAAAQNLDLSRIGASDVPALLGVDPYRTPAHVYSQIVHGIEPPKHPDVEESAQWGHRWEPLIADVWEEDEREARSLFGPRVRPESHSMALRPWQRVTPDFVYPGPNRMLECKLISQRRHHNEEGWGMRPGDVPYRIVAQVTAQVEAMRADPDHWAFEHDVDAIEIEGVDVAVNVGGQRLDRHYVAYDAELGGLIAEQIERFWRDHIVNEMPPPVDDHPRSLEILKLLRKHSGLRPLPEREATPEEAELLRAFARLRYERRELKRDLEAAEARVVELIGQHDGLVTDLGRVWWSGRIGSPRWKDVALRLGEELGLAPEAVQLMADGMRGDPAEFLRCSIKTPDDEV